MVDGREHRGGILPGTRGKVQIEEIPTSVLGKQLIRGMTPSKGHSGMGWYLSHPKHRPAMAQQQLGLQEDPKPPEPLPNTSVNKTSAFGDGLMLRGLGLPSLPGSLQSCTATRILIPGKGWAPST